jgi:hypothetical protein
MLMKNEGQEAQRCLTCESLHHRECDPEALKADEVVEVAEPAANCCPLCGSNYAVGLGTMGPHTHWARCRNCGFDYVVEVKDA